MYKIKIDSDTTCYTKINYNKYGLNIPESVKVKLKSALNLVKLEQRTFLALEYRGK